MPPPTTLPSPKELAEKFEIRDLEIVEVDPCSARITTPHHNDGIVQRGKFWLRLFHALYGALHVVGSASCVFVIRRPEQALPLTLQEKVLMFLHRPAAVRYRPAVTVTIAVEDISFLDRDRLTLRHNLISFMVREDDARFLEKYGIQTQKVESFGRHRVTLNPLQMQSMKLHLGQILFL